MSGHNWLCQKCFFPKRIHLNIYIYLYECTYVVFPLFILHHPFLAIRPAVQETLPDTLPAASTGGTAQADHAEVQGSMSDSHETREIHADVEGEDQSSLKPEVPVSPTMADDSHDTCSNVWK